MANLGFVYNPAFLAHDTGADHPEHAGRLRTLARHLVKTGFWSNIESLDAAPAPQRWISAVHTPRLLTFIKDACRRAPGALDHGDTRVCASSFDVARLAAGGAIAAVDAVINGVVERVFCALRPPGHHAERDTAMGFCLLNHAAIATRYAQQRYGVGRVAIIDWDVHHGNGTQEIFYDDPTVFYVSIHQYPFYPGTGSHSECGVGRGEGFTLNLPMPAGSGEREYLDMFRSKIIPTIDGYRPELVIISAGFDAHRDDPLANINLTEGSFATMTEMVAESAARHSGGRIVSLLEGGYNLRALAASVEAHLATLAG